MYVVTLSEIEKMEKDIIEEGYVPTIQELIHRIKMQDLGNGDETRADGFRVEEDAIKEYERRVQEKIESAVDQAVEENQFKNLQ